MKIIDTTKPEIVNSVSAWAVSIGTVFTGEINGHTGTFMRSKGGVICLDNPDLAWATLGLGSSPRVTNYQERDAELRLL